MHKIREHVKFGLGGQQKFWTRNFHTEDSWKRNRPSSSQERLTSFPKNIYNFFKKSKFNVFHLHTPPKTHCCLLPVMRPLLYLRFPTRNTIQITYKIMNQPTKKTFVNFDSTTRPTNHISLWHIHHVLSDYVPKQSITNTAKYATIKKKNDT